VASRSPDRAEALARKCGGKAAPLSALAEILPSMDLLVAAAAARGPVLGPAELAGRAEKPLTVLDLGLPRNVAPEARALEGVTLKDIDDFKLLADGGRTLRKREAAKADKVIGEEVEKFRQWLANLSTSPTIKDLVRLAEAARVVELERTVAKTGFSPEQVEALEAMSRSLVRRLLHNPLAFVKGCHRHGRSDHVLDLFRRVFGLDP
jgi:glutamyl-tRNA reductase